MAPSFDREAQPTGCATMFDPFLTGKPRLADLGFQKEGRGGFDFFCYCEKLSDEAIQLLRSGTRASGLGFRDEGERFRRSLQPAISKSDAPKPEALFLPLCGLSIARSGSDEASPIPSSQYPIFFQCGRLWAAFLFSCVQIRGNSEFCRICLQNAAAVRSHLISFLFSTNMTKICGSTSGLFTIHDGKTRANFNIIE